jgi:hypothetical protein
MIETLWCLRKFRKCSLCSPQDEFCLLVSKYTVVPSFEADNGINLLCNVFSKPEERVTFSEWTTGWTVQGSNALKKRRLFCSPNRIDLIWKSTGLMFNGYLSYFLVVKRRFVTNTRLKLAQKLKMSGDIFLLLCISLGCGPGRIYLPLFLNTRLEKKSPKLGGLLILRTFSNRLCNSILKKRRYVLSSALTL